MKELENLNDLVSLQNQVNQVQIQDKSKEQNLHENVKEKIFEPPTDITKATSRFRTKTIKE